MLFAADTEYKERVLWDVIQEHEYKMHLKLTPDSDANNCINKTREIKWHYQIKIL
jgi:hypothetical protein